MDVGSVLVNIEGNTAGLNAAVDASVKKLEFLKGVVAGVGAEIQKAAGGDVEIKRLGDSLVKLGNDTKQAERGFQSITSVLGRFFTVAAGINFFRSAAETASHLVDLAKRTE
ncbi:MAG TPA: hypothetical protein VK192_07360, partial [Sphingomicrobium sp.]|nr:hypothetical protein [Sphingomicrobium sp.]